MNSSYTSQRSGKQNLAGQWLNHKRQSHSLARSNKTKLAEWLNVSMRKDLPNKCYISTSTEANPEAMSSPPEKMQHKTKKSNKYTTNNSYLKAGRQPSGAPSTLRPENKPKIDKKLAQFKQPKPKPARKIDQRQQKSLQSVFKQDVKLRIEETVQLEQWMQLIREYRSSAPHRQNQARIVLRELQKIVELREELELRKYKLISSIL